MTFRHLADAVLSALLSPPCAACARVLDHPLDGAVCHACWASITPRPSTFSLDRIALAQAMGPYEGVLRDIIHALKYDGRRSVARHLSRLMADHGQRVLAGADLVVPVPLHPRRQRERGFNQSIDLAGDLGLPVIPALRRVKATQPQVDLQAEWRRDNVRGAFAVSRRRFPAGGVVVLVDDVATTGATLEACARTLKEAGVAEVRALTAARVALGPR